LARPTVATVARRQHLAGREVEIEWTPVPVGGDGAPDGGPSRRTGWVAAAVTAVALVAAALALSRPVKDEGIGGPLPPTSVPATTVLDAPPTTVPPPHVEGRVVSVAGDKLLARSVDGRYLYDLLATIRVADDGRAIWALDGSVVALGAEMADDGRTGAWVIEPTEPATVHYLGSAEGMVPSVRAGRVWLSSGDEARELTLDGTVVDGPYALDGRLVGTAGAGLVLDRHGLIVWAPPGGTSRDIGAGRVLDTRGEAILWLAANGVVTLTDPNTGANTGLGIVLRSDPAAVTGALSPLGDRAAVMTEAAILVGDRRGDESLVLTAGHPVAMTWASDTALLVGDTSGALRLFDARGPSSDVAALPVAPKGLVFLPDRPASVGSADRTMPG
jgi:hypothetical protein